jgi:hypothetical protein
VNIKKAKNSLKSVARTTVIVSMHKAIDNCRRNNPTKKPEEPDYVAALVLDGTKILEKGWSEVLNKYGISLSITGIYCHQSPMLNYSGMSGKCCEIGDLLWCHFHRQQNGEYLNNAILFQAKKISRFPYKLLSSEMDQYNLYYKWPKFEYTRPEKLKNQIRHVTPSSPRRGAQYLTIDENSPGLQGQPKEYPCKTCLSINPLVYHNDLGKELTNSLGFLTGDMFDFPSSKDDWSKVICDLIQIAEDSLMNRLRSGYKNHRRIAGFAPSQLQGCISMSQNNPSRILSSFLSKSDYDSLINLNNEAQPNWRNTDNYFDEDGGISTIIVETAESEG